MYRKSVPATCSKICDVLNTDNGVAAIFGVESPMTSAVLQSICTNFDIPYIITSWRPPSTKQSGTVLNLFPEAELFAQGLAAVVESLHWKSFVIIYETEEGLIRMQEILKIQNFREDSKHNNIIVKQLGDGPDHRSLLKEIKNLTENNIILDCSTENIIPILKQAKDVNLLNLHNNYFLTSLDAHILDYSELDTTANITTIRLFDHKNENFKNTVRMWELNIYEYDNTNRGISLKTDQIKTETVLFHDALLLLTDSINDLLSTHSIRTNSINCFGSEKSKNGYSVASYMKTRQPSLTLSGPVEFDETGNRIDFNIHVVDILDEQVIATWYASNGTLNLTRNSNETDNAAVANLQKILVIVSSRIGEPYLKYRQAEDGKELAYKPLYVHYILVKDKSIITYSKKVKGKSNLFDNIIGTVLGISILYRKEVKEDINMFAFLDPFSISVWIYTATLYLIISVVLYFISRMTPGDWENPHPCDENPEELENIWDIKNCLWLTLGSIMTQGCDILPKGISSRMAVSMWWFFSLIMTSSYTANLAAFLTKDRMEPTIDGAEALSKQTKIKYGAVEGGSTQAFFRDSNFSTFARMWINMQTSRPTVFEKSNTDGVKRVQAPKGNYAFLMESTQIEYEIETKCDLKQTKVELLGYLYQETEYPCPVQIDMLSKTPEKLYLREVPYQISTVHFSHRFCHEVTIVFRLHAFVLDSPYRSAINKAILKLQESGKLSELKTKWWKEKRDEKSCDNSEAKESSDGSDLALANVGGVFFVLGIGIAIAFILAISEFLWNVRSVSVEEHLTYWEALKMELKFACNVWITKKRTKPLVSESSSAGSQKSDKTDNKSMVHSILQSAGSFMNLNNSN
ncbi:hypothetical protein NQ314_002860 [Rhamnusium bicolor]|uniref:Ionotropic glutamate receptor C-terminal domain-containing protein n=1 Tax=Rhamnusium bicolor TaxID=1586634 RepID=A0AAV8ZPZ2_9CUCU|nr:hypothetical protein NQ314_002860 [Rhamnusium bicolor]